MQRILNFLKDDSGATALEYSMIGALVSIIIVGVVTSVGASVRDLFFTRLQDGFTTPAPPSSP